MKRKTQKEYRKRRQFVTVTFNEEEFIELNSLMEQGEWENRAGFIKTQIFGGSHLFDYSRLAEKIKSKEDLQCRFMEDLKIFNRHLDYSALKHDELEKRIQSMAMLDETKIRRSIRLAIDWLKEVQQQEATLEKKVNILLRQWDIVMEREKADPVRSLPQSIIDQHMSNWNDTTSPEFLEGIRRKEENNQ